MIIATTVTRGRDVELSPWESVIDMPTILIGRGPSPPSDVSSVRQLRLFLRTIRAKSSSKENGSAGRGQVSQVPSAPCQVPRSIQGPHPIGGHHHLCRLSELNIREKIEYEGRHGTCILRRER